VPRHFLCLDFFLPLHEVDCHDCHVARDFQHRNHGAWVLVDLKGSTSVSSSSFYNANVLLFNSDLMLYFTFSLS
jgi:hypothetical protein